MTGFFHLLLPFQVTREALGGYLWGISRFLWELESPRADHFLLDDPTGGTPRLFTEALLRLQAGRTQARYALKRVASLASEDPKGTAIQ